MSDVIDRDKVIASANELFDLSRPDLQNLWYENTKIPALGYKSPKDLVEEGRGGDVLEYLKMLSEYDCYS